MQALKALVIFLGVLILAGVTVVAVTVYKRATVKLGEPAAASQPAQAFGKKQVPLPDGAHLEEVTSSGGRIILTLRLADGTPRILVLDLKSGDELGQFDFAPPEQAPKTP
jgi:hypothetical protein